MSVFDHVSHWRYTLADAWWYGRAYYVLGYPKSGTTWLSDLLGNYFQIPLHGRGESPLGSTRIVHTHRFSPIVRDRTVYLLRDGRDVMVSYYTALARQSSLAHHRVAFGKKLPYPLELGTLRDNLPDFIAAVQSQWRSSVGYRRHVQCGLSRGLYVIRYEQLREDTLNCFAGAVSFLCHGKFDPDRVNSTVEMNSLEHVRSHPRDNRQREFLGTGSVQGWKNQFTREAGNAFVRYCGDALIKAGYEADNRWVDELPLAERKLPC